MSKVHFLPLGTVVRLEKSQRYLMIIARGLNVKINNEEGVCDYAAVLYPEGLTGDELYYFNADVIEEVICQGAQDELGRKYTEVLEKEYNQLELNKIETRQN